MSQKPRRIPVTMLATKSRPGMDIGTAERQASQFPSVGMTLHSYKYDSRDYHGRPTGQAAIVKGGRFKRLWKKITLKRVVVSLAILVLLVGGWVGGTFLYNAHKLFGGSILGVLHTTKLKGENVGRVNILLAGNSADDVGHDGAQLTDSIMLLSIDTKNNKAFMLSIPRDLWVQIGDQGHAKINAAYVYGEEDKFSASDYPTGGMGQLEQVVEENLSIPINYYALVDYNAFREAVNSVGGIEVNIASSDPRGIYDPSIDYSTGGPLVPKLSNGVHHLNGQQALDLARARGDSYNSYGFAGSDFDRTQHQREMLIALKSKAVSAGVLANPAKLTSLSNAIGNNVKTDLTFSEVRRLIDLIKPISGSNIQSLSLNKADGKNLLTSYAAPGGQSALAPAAGLDDFSDIQAFLQRHTSNDPVVQENATVAVLNGTSTSGLASKKRTTIKAKNINVTEVGDAKAGQTTTTIIDTTGGKKPATLKVLEQLFGMHVSTANPYAGTYTADFIIVLGNDQATTTPSTTTTQ